MSRVMSNEFNTEEKSIGSQVSEERSEYSLNSEMALISDKTLGETFMGLTSVHKNWLPQLMHFPSRENYGNLENFGGTVLLFLYLGKGKPAVVRSQPEPIIFRSNGFQLAWHTPVFGFHLGDLFSSCAATHLQDRLVNKLPLNP